MINGSFWVGAAIGAAGRGRAARSGLHRPRTRLAPGLPDRRSARRRRVPHAPVDSREPALARHPRARGRPRRSSRGSRRVSRSRRRSAGAPDAGASPPPAHHTPLAEVVDTLFDRHRGARGGLALMAAQAFFYNAIFFTYALVLTKFYGVRSGDVGWYILPFAVGNFLGPLLLGRLFDTLGRRHDRADLCALRPAADRGRRRFRADACRRPPRRSPG